MEIIMNYNVNQNDNNDKKLIYIADDEQNIRQLIQQFLICEGFDVECFSNGQDIIDAFHKKPCDMLVLDIMMPELDGLSVCRLVRQQSNVPIIIVSAKDDPLDRVTGITLGGDDYMIKPFLPLELVTRIKALFRRAELNDKLQATSVPSAPSTPEFVYTFGDLSLNTNLRTITANNNDFSITPTEFDFLVYLIRNKERAISRSELLKKLWQFDTDIIDTRVTDDLVKRLRKKLKQMNSCVQIDTVWGYGFRLLEVKN